MINQITAIMPTHNRHQYLERALDYYNLIDLQFKLIVLDSSKLKYTKEIKHKNIDYVYCPEKKFLGKINDAMSDIKTEFVVLCADDDFIIQEGVEGCLDFLRKNVEHVAVQGLVTRFLNLGEIIHMPDEIKSIGRNFDSNIAEQRIRNGIFDCYTQTFYSVYKTQILQVIMNEAIYVNYNLFELFITISTYSLGKYAVVPSYYYVREDVGFSEGKNIVGVENFISYEKEKLSDDYERFLVALERVGKNSAVKKSFYSDLLIEHVLKFDPRTMVPRNNTIRKFKVRLFKLLMKPVLFLRRKKQLKYFTKESIRTISLVGEVQQFPFSDKDAAGRLQIITSVVKKYNLRSL